ncbi:hypothetical protein EK0264_17715 [Epidermidibacterium keratini]|uniref:Uncharacterized protein n=1 Tax=Epidermidibacterium keratini TaxID=1891644 RepID=A0A7L4YS40_9ACTN|nr:hypothetical protein [Epidermidibacterium keratini]QHC01930.1 hypothetical protein EK0264_17715 [Epidermidibacterium keratini]
MSAPPIDRLAVIPSAPLLLPGATGRDVPDEVARLRDQVTTAVRWLAEGAQPLTVVIAGEPRRWEPAVLSARELGIAWTGRFGTPAAEAKPRADYPTALLVAAAYTDGLQVVCGLSTPGETVALESSSVLVVGGGSARRGEGAPGHIDPRAVPHDDETARLLSAGDGGGFAARDLTVAAELLDDLSAPMAALGGQGAPRTAQLDYYAAPYGVGYLIARWQW